MSKEYSDLVETARDYYNSEDADTFYRMVWGGEDLHIGLYEYKDEPIGDASRRTVAHMADLLGEPQSDWRVLDMGAGYGGVARYLVENYGCAVTALNLSEKENQRDREINQARKLDHKITVVDGSFEQVDEPDASYDVVWSEDSFLHSGEKEKVIQEAARLLKPGGWLIFTDPMQTDDCPAGVLDPILRAYPPRFARQPLVLPRGREGRRPARDRLRGARQADRHPLRARAAGAGGPRGRAQALHLAGLHRPHEDRPEALGRRWQFRLPDLGHFPLPQAGLRRGRRGPGDAAHRVQVCSVFQAPSIRPSSGRKRAL